MKHRHGFRKLGLNRTQRRSLFRSQVTSLIKLEQICTTVPKAKELRTFAERVITIAKKHPVCDDRVKQKLAEYVYVTFLFKLGT